MKNLILYISLFFIFIVISGCHRNDNNYTAADHTVGMLNVRTWSGTANGNTAKDTLIGTTNTKWLAHFSRTITDTTFAVQKIDGFSISILGTTLQFVSTDSVTTKTVN